MKPVGSCGPPTPIARQTFVFKAALTIKLYSLVSLLLVVTTSPVVSPHVSVLRIMSDLTAPVTPSMSPGGQQRELTPSKRRRIRYRKLIMAREDEKRHAERQGVLKQLSDLEEKGLVQAYTAEDIEKGGGVDAAHGGQGGDVGAANGGDDSTA